MRTGTVLVALVLSSAVLVADDHTVLFDEDVNFATFKTFTVVYGKVNSPRAELNSPLTVKKLGDAIRAALTTKGLKEALSQADLVVEYSLSAVDWGVGPGGRANPVRPGRSGAQILQSDFTEGTLVIDLKHGQPPILVWRGVYHDSENDAGKLASKLPADATKLFAEYPPKKGK